MISPRQTEEGGLVSFDAVFSKVEAVGPLPGRAHTVRSLRRMRIRIHPALPPLAIPPAAGDEGEMAGAYNYCPRNLMRSPIAPRTA